MFYYILHYFIYCDISDVSSWVQSIFHVFTNNPGGVYKPVLLITNNPGGVYKPVLLNISLQYVINLYCARS